MTSEAFTMGGDQFARIEIRRLERLADELLDRHGTTLRDENTRKQPLKLAA